MLILQTKSWFLLFYNGIFSTKRNWSQFYFNN